MIKLNLHLFRPLTNIPEFWVIISLMLVMLPHLDRFPIWLSTLIFSLLIYKVVNLKGNIYLPPKWLLMLISISSLIGIFLSFGTLFGKTAGSASLCVLLAIKLHESESRRDYMLLISLSFFIIVTNFLFSQSIPTVIFMLISVVFLIVSLLSINQDNANLDISYKFKFSALILFQAIPLTLIMFLLFPRISGPIWQLPDDKQSSQSGLSDTMSPGNISNLIQSNAVAFRVKFNNNIPEQKDLYWRALVLWYFDGNTWEQGKQNISPRATLYSPSNNEISYTVTLEPHQKNWLYALDIPSTVPNNITYTNNYNLRSKQKITTLYQYTASSVLDYFIQASIPPWENSAGLKIPLNTNPKTIQMGKQLSQLYQDDKDIIEHVLKYFNQEKFHYTLRPPLTPGLNSVDQFLFKTRRGFCEHYASSFTLLMRAAGIPARVVMGFQGGTINPLNKSMTVRNRDAHAWSEVWYKHQGWIRIDPTAAIAPQRIEQNLQAALDPSETKPFHLRINSGLIKDALFYLDAIDNQWNQWIVGYDEKFQQQFLERIFNEKIEFSEIVLLMIISFTFMLFALSLYIIKPWHRQPIDPVVKIYNEFCKKLSSKGITREAYEGPMDYAKRATKALPEYKRSIDIINQSYIQLRYEKNTNEKQITQFKHYVKKLKLHG